VGGFFEVVVPAIVAAADAAATAVAAASITDIALTAAVVGGSLSVAGTVTGNKTLSLIGAGIGIAGGVTGLAASAGLFAADAGTEAIVQGAMEGPLAPGTALDASGATIASEGVSATPAMAKAATGADLASVPNATPIANANPSELPQLADMSTDVNTGLANSAAQSPVTGSSTPPSPSAGSNTWDTPEMGGLPSATPPPSVDSVTGGVQNAATTAPKLPDGAVVSGWGGLSSKNLAPIDSSTNMFDWFSKLDPATKMALTMTAGQGLSGAVGGMFQGMTASQRLAFDQLVNSQRQQIAQTQLSRATATPGIVQFAGQGNPNAPKVTPNIVGAAS